jgi:hypothetical protein
MNNRQNSQTDDLKSTQRLQRFKQSCYKTLKRYTNKYLSVISLIGQVFPLNGSMV